MKIYIYHTPLRGIIEGSFVFHDEVIYLLNKTLLKDIDEKKYLMTTVNMSDIGFIDDLDNLLENSEEYYKLCKEEDEWTTWPSVDIAHSHFYWKNECKEGIINLLEKFIEDGE